MHHHSLDSQLDQSVVYRLSLKEFTPAGTLNAAARLLPAIADMGIDMVCLSPLFKMGAANPNPYCPADYRELDAAYGDEDDLDAFVTLAHQLGLSILMEVPLRTCSPDASFITEYPSCISKKKIKDYPVLSYANQPFLQMIADCLYNLADDFQIDGFVFPDYAGKASQTWDELGDMPEQLGRPISFISASSTLLSGLFEENGAFLDTQWATKATQAFAGKITAKDLMYYHIQLKQTCDKEQNLEGARLAFNANFPGLPQEAGDAALLLTMLLTGSHIIEMGQEYAAPASPMVDWSNALTSDGQARLEFIKKLLELRETSEVICQGSVAWLENSTPDSVLAFLKLPVEHDHCDCDDDCDCDCEDDCDCDCDCEDDDCDCGCEDDDCDCEEESNNVLVVINTTDKPLTTEVYLGLKRGTLLNAKMMRGVSYKPQGETLKVDMLPYGFLVLEF